MTDSPSPVDTPAPSNGPRWWPLIAIPIAEAAWLTWVWQDSAIQRQAQVLKTIGGLGAGVVALLVWLLAFSRLRWKTRLTVLAVFLLPVVIGAALFRPAGVTGDLVPIFAPRWSKAAHLTPAKDPAAAKVDQRLPEGFVGFPQFLGPRRDGIIPDAQIARDWSATPPRLLWRVPVGTGYSGIAIAGARVLTLEQLGGQEAVVCRDLFSGQTLWQHNDATRFENSVGGIGPRTTPAVADGRVFAVGATGHLRALDLETGKLLWQRDIIADSGSEIPAWGVSGSPLVLDGLVIVHPGGKGHSLAAYRAETGEPVWAAGDARAGYSSPQLVTLLGERQILIFDHQGVTGHAAADGKPLWTYPWTNAAQHVSDPRVVAPNRFVVSSGYGAGADLVELSRDEPGQWKTSRVWHSRRLKSKFANMVVHGGHIYGLDDGRVTCIDLATGEPRWKGERLGHGQVLLADDILVITAENGDVVLQQATPDAAQELARFSALSGKMWNPHALAPPYLVVRTEEEAACYELPMQSASELGLKGTGKRE